MTAPDTQLVGQSLTLQCEVTTVSNIISSVDIVWSSGGMELNRTNNLTAAIMNDIVVYSDSYTTDPLNSNDNGSTIQCQVIINTTTNADTVELTLSGKHMLFYICVCPSNSFVCAYSSRPYSCRITTYALRRCHGR